MINSLNNNYNEKENNAENVKNKKRALKEYKYQLEVTYTLKKNNPIYESKFNSFKQLVNLEQYRKSNPEVIKSEIYKQLLEESNFSNLLEKPPVSTIYITKEIFNNLKKKKKNLEETSNYKKKLSKPESWNKINSIKKFHIKNVNDNCIVYSKSANIYLCRSIVLNKDNKIDVINKYGATVHVKCIYSDIDIINYKNNKNNKNNFILSNGEKVKLIIISEDKYNKILKEKNLLI
jgi:hypothetical protein